MKKIISLLIFMCTISGFAQFTQNFEYNTTDNPIDSSTGLPLGWNTYTTITGTNTGSKWTNASVGNPSWVKSVCEGSNSVFVDRAFIGQGNTETDYLVTKPITVPVNGELRFVSQQRLSGDQGNKYRLMVSANPDPSILSAYTLVQEWTENQMNTINNVCQEQKVDLTSYGGQKIYLAFVKVFTQPGASLDGDAWVLDNVRLFTKCAKPTNLSATNVFSTKATLSWTDAINQSPSWDYEYVLAGSTPTGNPSGSVTSAPTADLTGLTPNVKYEYYVRANCGYWTGDWAGPFAFSTSLFGTFCAEPIAISSLPFQEASNTSNFKDLIDGLGTNCGAVPTTTDYLGGNDVIYSYTATANGLISVKMTPTAAYSGVFIYDTCPVNNGKTACIAGMADNGSGVRFVDNIPVTAGKIYYIVISSSAVTQSFGYTLVVQTKNCTPPVGSIPLNSNITTSSVVLSWTNPTSATDWEVDVQPLGSSIPSGIAGTGTPISDPSKPATVTTTISNLSSGTQYQYWVRSQCTPGVYSPWAGPYAFNTAICDDVNKCNYVFSMIDSANNGWNGNTMQVKQKGIVVATIGDTFTAGSGPVNISVPLCKDIPFELFWNNGGLQGTSVQCGVSIMNSYNQTIFVNPSGGNGQPGQTVYTDMVVCGTPMCNIVVTGLNATGVLAHEATIGWNAPSTDGYGWDIYVVPSGSPSPVDATVPTYPNTLVTSNPFTVTQYTDLTTNQVTGLFADTSYDYYVRVHCATSAPWSGVGTFKTLASCPKPTALNVTAITTTSATLNWTNGSSVDNLWDILLVKGYPTVPTPPTPNTAPTYNDVITNPYPVSSLDPATIYYYYVRTVCPGNDNSTWAGPFVFNTSTCDPANKCNYKFILSDSGNDGWNNGRMQVRQNGIVVANIGSTISGGGPTTVSVGLCDGVPFDLYWVTAGDKPGEIGIKIQNPYTDVIYTKLPGDGTPKTVLFPITGIINASCSPPTCPKPTGLITNFVGATSATVAWTEGAGGAIQWNVCVVPAGSAPPVNGTPVSNVKPNYVTSQNPFTIPVGDLQPSTAYDFYVRSMCSGTDISTWQIINHGSFVTTPINDDCANAIPLTVNTGQTCDVVSPQGNTFGATQSQPLTSPVCSGNTADDVWYSFIASSDMHLISFTNIAGTTTDLNHVLYSAAGTDCSNLTQVYCSDPNNSIASGLVAGKTYYIRVYTKGFDKTQSATFKVCITTPPAIINDECVSATTLPVNSNVECLQSVNGSLTRATQSSITNACIGTADDDVWYSFVAKTNKHFITLSNVTGTTNNLDHAVYTGDCSNLSLMFCGASNSLQSYNTNYVVGQTYYVRVWSFESVKQGVDFNICVTTVNPPITTDVTKYSDQQLVEDVLLGTKCASVTNVTSSTGTKYGSVNGIGYFNKGNSDFVFNDGVVLSTGAVIHVPGPNTAPNSDGNYSWLGDTDLEQIILQGTGQTMQSYNASILEFDFSPISDHLSFNFLFASDEYGAYQCSYADAFAFILTNKLSGEVKNLAVVPGTQTPVSVITIRDKKYNNGCESVNSQYFDKFYSAAGGLNVLGDPINFNGLIVPLKAEANVFAGVPYHIKMVVADRGDYQLDTAVFLEGGSFTTGSAEADLGPDKLISNGTALCNGDVYKLSISLSANNYDFQWYKDGNILAGETSPSYTVTQTGDYSVEAKLKNSTCFDTYSIKIEYYLAAGKPKDLVKCNALNTDVFDLTINSSVILAPYNGSVDYTLAYFESQNAATNNTNPIQNPATYTNTSNPQIIYARVDNHIANCFEIVTFQLILQDKTPNFKIDGNTNVCLDGSTILTVLPNGFDPKTVTYAWEKDNVAIAGATGQSLTIKGTDVTNTAVYGVTVNDSGCTANQSVTVTSVSCTIQKGISPDGDGKNDDFDLTAMNPKRLEIFNRYGTEVFSMDGYTKEWHGQMNSGKDLPDGTYFYEIHTRDNKLQSGWIYINRKHN